MKRISRHILVSLAAMSSMIVCAQTSPGATIESVIGHGDFIPRIPSAADVDRELGPATRSRMGNESFLCYSVGTRKLILFLDEGADDNDAAVEEVAVFGAGPVGPDHCPPVDIPALSKGFHGLDIGASVAALHRTGLDFSLDDADHSGMEKLKAYTFSPLRDQHDLYHRFYVQGNKVVGYSIGVTE